MARKIIWTAMARVWCGVGEGERFCSTGCKKQSGSSREMWPEDGGLMAPSSSSVKCSYMLRYYFICAHNAIVVVRPVVRSCPCAPFCEQEHGRLYPRGGSRVEVICSGGRRRGPSSNPANRDPQRQAALRLARRPEDGGSGLRCWPAASRRHDEPGAPDDRAGVRSNLGNSSSLKLNIIYAKFILVLPKSQFMFLTPRLELGVVYQIPYLISWLIVG